METNTNHKTKCDCLLFSNKYMINSSNLIFFKKVLRLVYFNVNCNLAKKKKIKEVRSQQLLSGNEAK